MTLDLSLHLVCTHENLKLLNVGSISFKRSPDKDKKRSSSEASFSDLIFVVS